MLARTKSPFRDGSIAALRGQCGGLPKVVILTGFYRLSVFAIVTAPLVIHDIFFTLFTHSRDLLLVFLC